MSTKHHHKRHAKPKEVRQARAYLGSKGVKRQDMSARDFADGAAEINQSFDKTLELVATLQMGGQGQGPAPVAAKIAEKEAAAQ